MTTLARPVTRATSWMVRDGGKPREIVCTMAADGLHLRQKGRRTCFTLPYPAAYGCAVKLAVAQERAEKKARKR